MQKSAIFAIKQKRAININKERLNIFWFRRDLRLDDNRGLCEALKSPYPVLPLFIFDTEITDELVKDDPRVNFIYRLIQKINNDLKAYSSGILCKKGKVITVLKEIIETFNIQQVYCNEDYEPYAINRDDSIKELLAEKSIPLFLFKDQVIFSKDEIVKQDNLPYTVFTPYKNK